MPLLNLTLCADRRCDSGCKAYIVPLGRCYSPTQQFPADPQWGSADILDEPVNSSHLSRSFFATTNGTCQHQTDGFLLPLHECIGPFGRPRPFGTLSTVLAESDETLCRDHVATHVKDVRREAKGALAHPYLVPAGPYEQLWDWDAVFLGVATLRFGNRAYFAGSMRNFFDATNLSTGAVTGCLTWNLPVVCSSSPTEHDALVHAKPILVQGAWLAANSSGDASSSSSASSSSAAVASWERHAPAIEALLAFWERPPRKDPATGLRTWHDQMESGADNGVLSLCPNARSSCWTASQAYSLASADVLTLLQREHTAAAHFYTAWADVAASDGTGISQHRAAQHRAAARRHRQRAESTHDTLNAQLWRGDLGYHVALNVSSRTPIAAKTYAVAYPLWARLVNRSQAASIASLLGSSEMLSAVGLRSASALDPRYSNADTIIPYSNWRGPAWVNVNAMACYGLAAYGFRDLALEIASRVTGALATDLRSTVPSGHTWHEAYSTDSGAPIGGRGFLSWDTLSAELLSNLRAGIDPMRL